MATGARALVWELQVVPFYFLFGTLWALQCTVLVCYRIISPAPWLATTTRPRICANADWIATTLNESTDQRTGKCRVFSRQAAIAGARESVSSYTLAHFMISILFHHSASKELKILCHLEFNVREGTFPPRFMYDLFVYVSLVLLWKRMYHKHCSCLKCCFSVLMRNWTGNTSPDFQMHSRECNKLKTIPVPKFDPALAAFIHCLIYLENFNNALLYRLRLLQSSRPMPDDEHKDKRWWLFLRQLTRFWTFSHRSPRKAH